MTNPIINPQPNYSGVTIQISNPAVYANSNGVGMRIGDPNGAIQTNTYSQPMITDNVAYPQNPNNTAVTYPQAYNQPVYVQPQGMAYPPQYYLNNYNYQNNGVGTNDKPGNNGTNIPQNIEQGVPSVDNYEQVAGIKKEEPQDFSKSNAVIEDLNSRAKIEAEEKKYTKQKRVVALTDEYIKSLENYLNNPNNEVRLMASKEILKRLDEDKNRYDDAALNALLNKMLQDPSKLIRVAALSAYSSRLASGNDYTVELLHKIEQDPKADKEDVLQVSDILLKMSAKTEMTEVPVSQKYRRNFEINVPESKGQK